MAKCYVGTYGKYNEGSIYGKWLDLNDYPTYADFCAACRDLHKNERDPEFMILDWAGLPDGFPAVEWIGESEFNDIKAAMQDEEKADLRIIDYSEKAFAVVGDTKTIKDDLKRLGGRFNSHLSCGAGWIFSKKSLDEVQKFINCGEVTANNVAPKAEKDEALWDEFKKRVLKAENNEQSWLDYWVKKTSNLMMTDSGIILTFEKRKIKVDFCWPDEGAPYEEYLRLSANEKEMREYFLRENLRDLDEQIEELTTRKGECDRTLMPVFLERDTCHYGKCGWAEGVHLMPDYRYREAVSDKEGVTLMTENDCTKALAILKDERIKFEKRLQTYLKRYGVSKLNTWTYWADR